MSRRLRLLLVGLMAVAFAVGCSSSDKSSPPVVGTLSGKVYFHGEWPDSGTVQLSMFTGWNIQAGNCSWCPEAAGGPPAYYTPPFQGDTSNHSGLDSAGFTITGISLGTYRCIAMGWRAPNPSDIDCGEPVIGLYDLTPGGSDSIPAEVTFTENQPDISNLVIHAWFDRLPVPGCDSLARIEGTIHPSGTWPDGGYVVLLTNYPFAPWLAPGITPPSYAFVTDPLDTTYRFLPRYGTYYLSVWTGQPPNTQWHGSYGVNTAFAASDAHPDSVTVTDSSPAAGGINITATNPAPHWISGNVTFNGTRPPEGLLVLLSTFPYTPEHPPSGQPSAYFQITNPNETLYALTGMATGIYYISLWSNSQSNPVFYGAYGYTSGSDTAPDPVTISTTQDTWGLNGIDVTGHP